MKIAVFSDLHLEWGPIEMPPVAADVVILAGDIHAGVRGIAWARETFPDSDVVYVLGNHEFYGETLEEQVACARDAAQGSRVHLLDNEAITLGGVRFVGTTLWTDFALDGMAISAMREAQETMADFSRIRVRDGNRPLLPVDTLLLHQEAIGFIERSMNAEAGEPTVCVTHHAPSLRSTPRRFRGTPLNAAFASALDGLVAKSGFALWVHGHVHDAADYRIGTCRVVCNPRGYPHAAAIGFDPTLVVEV